MCESYAYRVSVLMALEPVMHFSPLPLPPPHGITYNYLCVNTRAHAHTFACMYSVVILLTTDKMICINATDTVFLTAHYDRNS